MNHLGEIKELSLAAAPIAVCVITNIAPSHIGFLKNIKNVIKAKEEIFYGLKEKEGIAILNADDIHLKGVINRVKRRYRLIKYGINSKDADIKALNLQVKNTISFVKPGLTFDLVFNNTVIKNINMRLLGKFNVYHALPAASIGKLFGIDDSCIKQALEEFTPLSHRMNLTKIKNFYIIDDCYNSNPASLKAAIEVLSEINHKNRKVLILADMLELGEFAFDFHQQIGLLIDKTDINLLITYGELAGIIADTIKNPNIKRFKFKDMQDLLNKIKDILKERDLILIKGSRKMQLERVIDFLKRIPKD
jgi:UDP-N-acetylmuramoyl-tripeptide--D-alanyl-D-alanine ligase